MMVRPEVTICRLIQFCTFRQCVIALKRLGIPYFNDLSLLLDLSECDIGSSGSVPSHRTSQKSANTFNLNFVYM